MWIPVIILTVIALIAGLGLGLAARKLPPDNSDLVERVNDLLPQTQCAQCGYPGCRPYARAVVDAAVAKWEAVITAAGEWIRYSTPEPGGAEYIAICLPAFSPDIVHRDSD